MTGYLIGALFGTAFIAAVWTIVASVESQIHRYRTIFPPEDAS